MIIPLSLAVVLFEAAGMWFLIGEMFVLGAALGSFFNVVAYRLPLGMSLVRPPSQCPSCRRPIRWYDNVPIVGWLMLGGRCRNCLSPISPRYPLVELAVAGATALVTWSQFAPVAGPDGVERYALDAQLLAFRLGLWYTLVCAALLEWDAHGLPLRLLIGVLAVGALLSTIWPELRPVEANFGPGRGGLMATLWAVGAGVLLGLLSWPLLVAEGDGDAIKRGAAGVSELALVGVFLGTTAAAATALFAIAWVLATGIASRFFRPAARFGWATALVIGTLVWIVGGTTLVARWESIAGKRPATVLVAAGAIVAVGAIAGRLVRRQGRRRQAALGEHS